MNERLKNAIRAVTREAVGIQRIKIEGDPLYGIQPHERWYPKAILVDTDIIVELQEAYEEESK